MDFQIEEDILDGCIVKLVLQPLLENAIYYGMEFMDGEGEIHVRGYRKDKDVYLEVEDNGLGMPEEEAAELLNGKERPHKHGSGVWSGQCPQPSEASLRRDLWSGYSQLPG